MKNLFLVPTILTIMLSISSSSLGQFNRRAIKKNNKRIATHRGRMPLAVGYSGIGISFNALNYYGDLSPLPNKFSTDISFTKPGIGISFFHRYGPRYILMGQFMYGTLKGSDAESAKGSDGFWRKERNLSFRNHIKELSLTAVFDLFENQGTYISRVNWTPYVFIGVAAFIHNPQAQAPNLYLDGFTVNPKAGQWVDLQPLGTEGQHSSLKPGDVNYGIKPYALLQIAIPFGVGARFRINEVLDLWADIGFRYTSTDYLDDVSRNYVDLGVFGNNELAKSLSYRSNEISSPSYSYNGRDNIMYHTYNGGYGVEQQTANRGNRNNRDVYMVTSLKITYIVGAKFHRPKFR